MKGTSPEELRKIMRGAGLRFNKALGQNFLVDEGVLVRIVTAGELTPDHGVLEIGAGAGTLTRALADAAGRVCAIELDRRLAAYLQKEFASQGNVKIIQGDAMRLSLSQVIGEELGGRPVAVVANLPYYVTTPLIMRFLEEELPVEGATVMIQKEVADRIVARPGTPDYGALSVAAQYYCSPRIVELVPPACFLPPPKVTSAVIRLELKNHIRPACGDEKRLFQVVRAAFGQRRKTLVNALSAALSVPKDDLRALIVELFQNENIRGEALGVEAFIILSHRLFGA